MLKLVRILSQDVKGSSRFRCMVAEGDDCWCTRKLTGRPFRSNREELDEEPEEVEEGEEGQGRGRRPAAAPASSGEGDSSAVRHLHSTRPLHPSMHFILALQDTWTPPSLPSR